jgi:hypothetical protein
MKLYFLIVEVFSFLLMLYVVLNKRQLSVVYLPVFYFSMEIIDPILPALISYFFIAFLIFYFFIFNLPFMTKNFFSVIILGYFSVLLINVTDINMIRPFFFGVLVLFLLIGILPEIYKKYNQDVVSNEVNRACFLILTLFVSNTVFSTIYNFNPHLMYGISSGVVFGNLIHADFHILPLALYILLKSAIREKNIIFYTTFFLALILTLLTFRRTVMVLSLIGSLLVIIEMVSFENIRKMTTLILVFGILGLVVVKQTGFLDIFWERYQLRNLENRDLESELRYVELGLVYEDLFIHYDYSPWFGYGLFQLSGKNYGKGILGDRPIHTDLMALIHSSGIIGLSLYIFMVGYAFLSVWVRTHGRENFIQYFYVLLVFMVFFATGRYTNIGSSLIIYIVLFLPIAKSTPKVKNTIGTEKAIAS